MNLQTLNHIKGGHAFYSNDHFVIDNGQRCKLVAIHNRDKSTEIFYREKPDCIRVTLLNESTGVQAKYMLDKNTLFQVKPMKKERRTFKFN
ncbi:hypothetical protein [Vibrio vulnificus]|uniref:hypothetical protein n=1 Tax=Vibrio vulnificus TaxID=672 RepID=UPI003242AE0E